MKKLILALIVLIILLVGGGLYWRSMQKPSASSDPMDAIPVSAALVIGYPNLTATWESFLDKDYYEALWPVKELRVFFARNNRLDSLIRHDEKLSEMLSGASVWSSYHAASGDSLQFFHVIQAKKFSDSKVLDAWKSAFSGLGELSEESGVGETPVFKLTYSSGPTTFFTVSNGLIMASSTKQLLLEALGQLSNGTSLLQNASFAKALETAGKNVDANVFINYSHLPEYLSVALKPAIGSTERLVEDFAEWTELDVNLKPEGLTMNGFTYVNDSLPQFMSLFLNQKPQSITFPEFLPANTASFAFFGIDDVISFASDYRKLLQKFGKLEGSEAKLDSLNETYGVDFEQNLLAWMGNTFGVCITQPQTESFAENSYLVFDARSEQLATKLLTDLSAILGEKNGVTPEEVEVNGVKILQLPLAGILGELFGDGFEVYENPSFMVYNEHVIFGTDSRSLAVYLQYIQSDRTLGKELSFSRFAENLGSTFNVFTYNHIIRSRKIFESYLNTDAVKILNRNTETVNKFEAIGTQLSTTGQSFYSTVFARYDPNAEKGQESQWKAELDAKPAMVPVFVKNHLSNELEILVQDDSNAVYLFNQFGQELFKVQLSEKIMSTPVQVDAFKNGKLQYIFNTANYIHLIDRDGSMVDGFPVKLKAPAETELSVFDYDKDLDYRLLITCTNKRIYNFDIKGRSISGWRHNRSSDPTIHSFKHMMVSGKDYIVTGESNGKIHLLDRRGKNRVTVEKRVECSKNNYLQVYKSSESALTGVFFTDDQGKIYRVSLDGDIQPMDLGKFSPEHHFLVADIDKDGGPEFIFSDLNMLRVFNYKKEKVFEQRIEPSATTPFLIDLGSDEIGIGYCYKDSEQLVLFDSKGKMAHGFPLAGNSEFSLHQSDSETLVVSHGNGFNLIIQAVR